MKTFLYDKLNTRILEKKLEKKNIPSLLLMMRAGHDLYKIVKKKFDYEQIIVIAGPGNNGGDAIAFSIQAKLNNENIILVNLSKRKNNSKKLLFFLNSIGLKEQKFNNSILKSRKKILILDGILGIGISRKPEGLIEKTIKLINKVKKKNINIVSIDIPSGLNPDTGLAYPNTICANHTIMCLTRKQGCYTGDGLKFAGELLFTDLGITNSNKIQKVSSLLLDNKNKVLIKRKKSAHKGKFGNVLILGGWDNMPGAANLSALAALKTGCGKVFICTNNFNRLPNEVIRIPAKLESISKIIDKMDVAIAGPGLGNNGDEILKCLWKKKIPLVLDADGINWLTTNSLKRRRTLLIGTPHHGEARNLLGMEFRNRFEAIKNIHNKYGGRWVLKGPGTLVINNNNMYINDFSNSILASAGTGDVLAGIIGALIAQKNKHPEVAGVIIHTIAAKKILAEGQKTLVAGDLLKKIGSSIEFY